jgi:hypothetical protein
MGFSERYMESDALLLGLHRGPAAPFTGRDWGELDSWTAGQPLLTHHSPTTQLQGRLALVARI